MLLVFVFLSECSLNNGAVSTSKSKFDDKIEASSAKMYFHYYGQLLHQQNMLQDFVRTGILNFDIMVCCLVFLLECYRTPPFCISEGSNG